MKRLSITFALIAMLVVVSVAPVAAQDTNTVSLPVFISSSNVVDTARVVPQKVDVVAFPGPDGVAPDHPARAILHRYSNRVRIRINTNNLDPHALYTVWAVVWNDPSQCIDGCGEDDLGVTGNAVFWATGGIANESGKAHFFAEIPKGPAAGQTIVPPGGPGGLMNPEGAEIHFVIRTHGLPLPGHTIAQLTTVGGGCDVDSGGTLPVGVGNHCGDHQAAVFLP